MLDISGWELATLVILAVIIFGPDRLPKAAADAGKLVKQVRHYINGAKADLTRELGPEFADVKVSDLTPRGMMRRALGDDDPFEDIQKLKSDIDFRKDLSDVTDFSKNEQAPQMALNRPSRPLGPGEMPPYDADAT